MNSTEHGRIEADRQTVELMGSNWFNWKDELEYGDLGNIVKEYRYSLGYQDEFIVRTHQHGASATYTVTGMTHTFKNPSVAFNMARQMTGRNKILNRMLE